MSTQQSTASTSRGPLVAMSRLGLAAAAALALVACGGGKDKPASQAAARVNSGEITVHQINQLLEQQRGLKPEQTEAASREALERLIEQELALQAAESQKLDREPRVVAAIEAAKRDIIARAWSDKVGAAVAKPTADEVKAYFDAKPALFTNRRIYSLQEFNIQVVPDAAPALQAKLQVAHNLAEATELLKAADARYTSALGTQAAEALPLAILDRVAALADGQFLVQPQPNGLKLLQVVSSKPAPVTLDQVRPAIEQYLLNDRKRQAVATGLKDLRAAAKIEYIGKFTPGAAAAPATAPSVPAPAAPTASTGLDDSALKKGLGLK